MRFTLSLLAIASAFLFTACSSNSPETTARDIPRVTKATKETYLSGDQFCAKYWEKTAKEHAVRVSVPRDYKQPALGSLTLYAYTLKPFDPSKPSYIYVDGGPGQNTHGLMPDYFGNSMNEIRYDQRGIGCSAPATFEQYIDAKQYSSTNNTRDLDLIRQAYGIEKWTVYGVSYGTVPATMYGSMFADHTLSVVIEGVVGDTSLLSDPDFKAKKLNLFLDRLTYAQREGFITLLGEDSADSDAIISGVFNSFYQDKGLATVAAGLYRYIGTDGVINRAAIADLRQRMAKRDSEFPSPQQPGAVDENIMGIIYCKDLGVRHRSTRGLSFDGYKFTVKDFDRSASAAECDSVGVPAVDEEWYRPGDYKTWVPTYYFQGALDGATVALSAYSHWQAAPQGKSYFLLAKRGGHNPNLTRLESETPAVAAMEHQLFSKAIFGVELTPDDVALANQSQAADEAWVLYLSKTETIDSNLEGLHVSR